MIKILYNDDNLLASDIDETVTRLKALIINSNNEILLGHTTETYQFPGGHLEEGEELLDGLSREIEEETGMVLDLKDLEPFELITYYSKNYFGSGKNRENRIYYYIVNTDEDIDLSKTNYTEDELNKGFTLERIKLSEVEKILSDSIVPNTRGEGIVTDMLEVLKNIKK